MQIKIGAKIKELRLKHKCTQEDLATALGVTPQAISRWESENGYPDIEYLPLLAEYFSVTTDELLGVNLPEKENRRAEIYRLISHIRETGANRTHLPVVREYLAEFPFDEQIRKGLADIICCSYMWEDNGNPPQQEPLKEAEKIYLTLMEETKNMDFRNQVIEALCALYAVGYRDERRALLTSEKLPAMRYSRELVRRHIFQSEASSKYYKQKAIACLFDELGLELVNYIINCIPNNETMWDEKIRMLEKILEFYSFIYGENLLYQHNSAAYIYRVIATYRVAQKKYESALEHLEKMCEHLIAGEKAQYGDTFTSCFTNQLEFSEADKDSPAFAAHNDAWYTFQKLTGQKRYDPLRNMPRFQDIVDKIRKIAR